MATWFAIKIKELMPNMMHLKQFTWQRSVLLGAGLSYAWSEGKWWHTPLIVVVPSTYVGYQAFKARDQIRAFISQAPNNERVAPSIHTWPPSGETNNYSSEPTHV